MRNSQTFPILEALAAAVCAFEAAGERIIRYGEGSVWNNSCGNKEVVQDFLQAGTLLTVTSEHRVKAEEIQTWLVQKMTMDLLKGSPTSGFFSDVCEILRGETAAFNKIGLLVWAPKLYKDLTARDERSNDIRTSCGSSKFIGQLGESIQIQIKIVDRHYLRDYNKWRYTGSDADGNLVQFYLSTEVGESLQVKARVRRHKYNSHCSNLPTTQLNYVKILP
jgi:hypothetical protein